MQTEPGDVIACGMHLQLYVTRRAVLLCGCAGADSTSLGGRAEVKAASEAGNDMDEDSVSLSGSDDDQNGKAGPMPIACSETLESPKLAC